MTEQLTAEIKIPVTSQLSAVSMGSGDLPVLATPAMIAGMEQVCARLAAAFLQEGETTVGTAVNVSHISATPVGDTVTYTCTLTSRDGRALSFTVSAYDSAGKIGEGTHSRFVVNSKHFLDKTQAKLK